MKVTLESKFDIGDEVFLLNDKPLFGIVKCIEFMNYNASFIYQLKINRKSIYNIKETSLIKVRKENKKILDNYEKSINTLNKRLERIQLREEELRKQEIIQKKITKAFQKYNKQEYDIRHLIETTKNETHNKLKRILVIKRNKK